MKNVVLLGSTGSIGTSTCKVAVDLPDDIRLIGLAAGRNATLLHEQVDQLSPAAISINCPDAAKEFTNEFNGKPEVHCGEEGLLKLATLPEADIIRQIFGHFASAGADRTGAT